MIICKGVSLLRNGKYILNDVSCEMPSGCYTALIGPNGAGKSSLLKCIGGEWTSNGRIQMHGRALMATSLRDAALERAIVPQRLDTTQGFTTLEYVVLGRYALHGGVERQADIAMARYWLTEVGLEHKGNADISTLSGGELQRAAFARACAQLDHDVTSEPKVLLLDESSSNLDLKHAQAMSIQCARLAKERGWCVVAVMHDLTAALRYTDRVIMLTDGRCVWEGPSSESMTPERLSAIFDLPLNVANGAVSVA